jgi:TolB-like protein
MAEERVQRRLAAILAADVVGYSRLMAQDEVGTLAALRARRKEVLEPLVAQLQGRIFKVIGDGVLIEFGSAVNAVQCAIELQRGMAAANGDLPDSRRIVLRVGVNLGDIMIEGGDLYGDGVNIAARLERMADPGDILVSGTAFDYVRAKVDAGFQDLGAQALKNLNEPVRVYRVADTPRASVATTQTARDKLSIAVLPFVNMGGDADQDYFADGMTEDIITELSRFRSLLVISRPSSFMYKGRSVSVQTVGRELGVHYVVEGSVRRAGDRVRVTVQLIEAETGSQLWAERYDRELADIFSVQDEVTQSIVANLAGRLDEAGGERALRKNSENLTKYDLLLQGRYFLNRGSRQDILRAREVFEQALALDCTDAAAHVGLAWTHVREAASDWAEAPTASAGYAFDHARTAVELDDRDSQAHLILGWSYYRAKSNFELAASQVERAITLNPNDCENYCLKSWLLTCTGDHDGGVICASQALRRSPLVPNDCLQTIGVAEYLAGRYEQALSAFGQMGPSRHLDICACAAACYAELGRGDDARLQAEEFLQRARSELTESPVENADSWRAYWRRRMPFKDLAQFDGWLDSLRKAGLPG